MSAEPSRAVFLSYASQDAQAARRIYDALRAAGIEIWYDQSELAGDAGDAVLRQQIQTCAVFMPIISANTQATPKGYYRLEWQLAHQRSQTKGSTPFIVPICIDETSDRDADVPDSFLAIPWMRVAGGDAGSLFAARVRKIVAPDRGEEPAAKPPAEKPPPEDAAAAQKAREEAVALVAAAEKRARRRRVLGWTLGAIGLFALVAGAAGYLFAPAEEKPAPPPRIVSVGVKPFDDFSSGRVQAYLSDGVTESLCAALGSVTSLRVPGWTSVMRYRDNPKSSQEIARELHLDAILEGSVQSVRNQILMTVQLVDVPSGRQLWGASYQRDLTDFYDVQREVARVVASQVGVLLNQQEQRRLSHAPSTNREVVQDFLQGRYWSARRTADGTRAAIGHLERATSMDSTFVEAHAALAFACIDAAYQYLSPADAIARAESAARDAVRRDSELPEAQSALGAALLHRREWNEAEAAFQEALRLNERDPLTHDWYAWYLMARGRTDQALREVNRALELAPQSTRFKPDLALLLLHARRPADALREAQEAVTLNPRTWQAHEALGSARMLQGDFKAAIVSLQDAQRLNNSPAIRSKLAAAQARAGQAQEAESLLAELLAGREKADPHIRADLIASVYAGLGRADEAFAWLDRAVQEKDPTLLWVRTAWAYDSLRLDPRYAKLLQKLETAK